MYFYSGVGTRPTANSERTGSRRQCGPTSRMRAAFPRSELFFCDLAQEGAEFCASKFNGHAIFSQPDLTEVSIPKELISSGLDRSLLMSIALGPQDGFHISVTIYVKMAILLQRFMDISARKLPILVIVSMEKNLNENFLLQDTDIPVL
jgi:hypothetical protein